MIYRKFVKPEVGNLIAVVRITVEINGKYCVYRNSVLVASQLTRPKALQIFNSIKE